MKTIAKRTLSEGDNGKCPKITVTFVVGPETTMTINIKYLEKHQNILPRGEAE